MCCVLTSYIYKIKVIESTNLIRIILVDRGYTNHYGIKIYCIKVEIELLLDTLHASLFFLFFSFIRDGVLARLGLGEF